MHAVHQTQKLTKLLQHLVALVENKVLHVLHRQVLALDETENTAWRPDNDLRLLFVELVDVCLDGHTSVEHGSLDVRHVFGETDVLVVDLVSELTGVAHDENGAFPGSRVELLEGSEHEHGGLAHAGFGLAKNVGSQDGLRNALLLDYTKKKQVGKRKCLESVSLR